MMPSKTFCTAPWYATYYKDSVKKYKMCCVFDTWTPADSPEAYYNTPIVQDVRAKMLKGEWHSGCSQCEYQEKNGLGSDRHTFNNMYKKEIADGVDTERFTLKWLDYRPGNLCNLKCRMCGPTDSSMWYDEQVKLWGDTYKDSHGTVKLIPNAKGKHVPEVNVYDWHESETYWEQMKHHIPHIKKLYIVGGEPFMIDQHYAFLQKCVDQGYAKDIVVEYNSNITNIPQRAWDIWKHFRRIGIGASIDAIGDLNDYIRHPSHFSKIWENLTKLSSADGNFKMWFATTISVYNVYTLPEMLEFIIRNTLPRVNDDDMKPIMSPHPLHGPYFLNIRMLPKGVKDKIASKYETSKQHLELIIDEFILDEKRNLASKHQMLKILDTYKEFMYAKDMSDKLPKFWEHTRRLDKIRGHSFETSCPEMYNLLKEYDPAISL